LVTELVAQAHHVWWVCHAKIRLITLFVVTGRVKYLPALLIFEQCPTPQGTIRKTYTVDHADTPYTGAYIYVIDAGSQLYNFAFVIRKIVADVPAEIFLTDRRTGQ